MSKHIYDEGLRILTDTSREQGAGLETVTDPIILEEGIVWYDVGVREWSFAPWNAIMDLDRMAKEPDYLREKHSECPLGTLLDPYDVFCVVWCNDIEDI